MIVKVKKTTETMPATGLQLWQSTEALHDSHQPTDVEIESTKNRALLSFAAEEVQHLDAASLAGLQMLLQHGMDFGRWQTPRKWSPLARDSVLDVDLRARIINYLPKEQQDVLSGMDAGRRLVETGSVDLIPVFATPAHRLMSHAVETLVRLLLLCRVGPAGIGRKAKGKPLDPSTIAALSYGALPRILAMGLARRLGALSNHGAADGAGLFAYVRAEDFDSIGSNVRARLETEVKRLHVLSERGLWSDVVVLDELRTRTTGVAGEVEPPEPEGTTDSHLPLPDEYVAEMGRHCSWLIKQLAPAVLTVAEKVRTLWLATDDPTRTPSAVAQHRDDAIALLLADAKWFDCEGRPIKAPIFDHDSVGTHANHWPPTRFSDFIYLLKLVQMAHLFVVGLSMAARKSELTTLLRKCVEYSKNGMPYATGRTWKLIERHDGEVRDWVLPDFAMHSVEQQLRLVKLVDGIGPRVPRRNNHVSEAPDHLWAEIGIGNADNTKPLVHTPGALRWFAAALGMDAEPGGQGLRVHRFRKTIARLAALAMTQAPKVLKDVFGHKSIEMTLYYILADKDLQADIERVSRELRVMKAKEAVEAIVAAEDHIEERLGGFGGPAAAMVSKAVDVHRARLHKRGEEWGAETARELAEILTLRGKAWQMVRPGIFCTKFPGTESGPCNKSKGAPEPARCQTHCTHRLEEPFLRADVEASLRESVDAYFEARHKGNELVQAFWAGQVKVHLGRFEDIAAKWSTNPTVLEVLVAGQVSQEFA